jgi:hypothetical protein
MAWTSCRNLRALGTIVTLGLAGCLGDPSLAGADGQIDHTSVPLDLAYAPLDGEAPSDGGPTDQGLSIPPDSHPPKDAGLKAKTVYVVNMGRKTQNPEDPTKPINTDRIDLSDIGFGTCDSCGHGYEIDSFLTSLAGLANEKELTVILTGEYVHRSRLGLAFWADRLAFKFKAQYQLEPIKTGTELLKKLAPHYDAVISYPPGTAAWGQLNKSCPKDTPDVCPLSASAPYAATCADGTKCSPYLGTVLTGDAAYNWVDEQQNHYRTLAANFVPQHRGLLVPEKTAVQPSFLGAMGSKKVLALKDLVNNIAPQGWSQWLDYISAHKFLLAHVFPKKNPLHVCINTQWDLCVQENAPVLALRVDLFHPADLELFYDVLSALDQKLGPTQYGLINGWSGSEEIYACIPSNFKYGIGFETNVGISALRRMPASQSQWQLALPSTPALIINAFDKYLTFVISDGNPTQAVGLYGDGWTKYHGQPERIPLTWQLRPETLAMTPFLADYYAETKADTDTFMMGPSGASYVHFGAYKTPAQRKHYIDRLNHFVNVFGVHAFEPWYGYHPKVPAILSDEFQPYDWALPGAEKRPNPFPVLFADTIGLGQASALLNKALTCAYDHPTYVALIDQLRAGPALTESLLIRTNADDAQGPAPQVLKLDSKFWNNDDVTAAGAPDLAAEANRIKSAMAQDPFLIVLHYPHEWDGPARMRDLSQLVQLGKTVLQQGVRLVSISDYSSLKKQAHQPSAGVLYGRIEAEELEKLDGSGGKQDSGWNMWTNGTIGHSFYAATDGKFWIRIRAKGQIANNQWPQIQVLIDGTNIASMTVATASYQDYEFEHFLASGPHYLAIQYVNDYYGPAGDRNVIIDRAELRYKGP